MLKDVFKSGGRNYKHYIRICKEAEKPAYSPIWDISTRWNSTYHMFQCGLKQKATLMYFHDLLANKGIYYLTSPLALQQIFFMSNKLTEYELDGGIFPSMVKPMKENLKKYFERMPLIIMCVAALNPCFNVHGVELLIETISMDLEFFDDGHATKAKCGSTTFWKDYLDAQERKQHTSTLENPLDFEDEILDAEVQENEATPLSDEEIALVAASQGTIASGSGG
nr:zinc finger BED domain-containing protein RICESLEEPER 2-like [Tanacetum cinerariifolium]